jgi:hypothetical protein
MNAMETLLDCLNFFNISVLETAGNLVFTQNAYVIEVEANGMYKLMQHGEVIAPFDDLNELSQFIMKF